MITHCRFALWQLQIGCLIENKFESQVRVLCMSCVVSHTSIHSDLASYLALQHDPVNANVSIVVVAQSTKTAATLSHSAVNHRPSRDRFVNL